ncbi:uncharacterized protein LTR77_010746 [Saxophila tyrrhenica]|uniref:Heterokaryon incompatibility domain-containing protein n=1 Tax=Saxophila tyrrhenica TaxID=1690608 RepID=A0AAV9NUI7_9PEZI|nr:hypothetical protein LTR77_010746 [Saxophila tyrrhenica]
MAHQTPWPICSTCRTIPHNIFTVPASSDLTQFKLWDSFTRFAESAARGCHTCTLLYEAVHEPYKSRLKNAEVYLESLSTGDNVKREVVVTANSTLLEPCAGREEEALLKGGNLSAGTSFTPIAHLKFALNHNEIEASTKYYQDMISLYAEDDGAQRYIRQSLDKCLAEHHESCNRSIFPLSAQATQRPTHTNIVYGNDGVAVAPTRLVYVGSDAVNDPPRIVPGEECLYKGGHLILSYCWGMTPKDAPWQLTSNTMESFAVEIPLNVLPQTLHDAFMWTRRLGEAYIWIDSMCIVQDSKEDWEREASRMASIYGCAKMTLVAASSSAYGGMTDRRNPLRNSAATLPCSEGTVYILPNGQKRSTPLPPPTESRGWCYQENLLSSRLVRFTRTSVQYQCSGDNARPPVRAQGLERLTDHPPFRWYILWYRLIERYTNMHLTYPADKLRAFHGIAMDKAGGHYNAGFLGADPWASLLWCRDEHQIRMRPGRRYEEYVAPSWSWAAVDAPVLFYEANGRSTREKQLEPVPWDPVLLSASVKQASYFDTGAVKSGSVQLSAFCALARTATNEPYLFNTKLGRHTYGRRNLRDCSTGRVIGLMVFDVASEAADAIVLLCVLLHAVNVELWLKNGTAGLGVALRLRGFEKGRVLYERAGYVQCTAAFAESGWRGRVEVV